MFNIQDFKNAVTIGEKIIFLVDDKNEDNSFGFTDSKEKIIHNFSILEKIVKNFDSKKFIMNSEKGTKTVFPLGRYITILEVNSDQSKMRLFLIDFHIDYSEIDKFFDEVHSDNFRTQIKKVKYEIEDVYEDSFDVFEFNTFLEPAI